MFRGVWLHALSHNFVKMLDFLVKVLALLMTLYVPLHVGANHDVTPERIVPGAKLATSPYPEWAHYHW